MSEIAPNTIKASVANFDDQNGSYITCIFKILSAAIPPMTITSRAMTIKRNHAGIALT